MRPRGEGHIVRTFIVSIITLFSVGTGCVDDVQGGWYKTEWGMTIEGIESVISEDITEIHMSEKGASGRDYSHEICDFTILGYYFTVRFAFNDEQLEGILVRLYNDQNAYACFRDLEGELKRKYGSPSESKDPDTNLGGSLREKGIYGDTYLREWVTDDSVIELSHSRIGLGPRRVAENITIITYRSRGGMGSDRF